MTVWVEWLKAKVESLEGCMNPISCEAKVMLMGLKCAINLGILNLWG